MRKPCRVDESGVGNLGFFASSSSLLRLNPSFREVSDVAGALAALFIEEVQILPPPPLFF
ncbi:MAG: hypothetical protein KDD53_09255 [Bdellovibrionales bacterium]|nr:hypothetical protein [Bdellovibrionales bacterium]